MERYDFEYVGEYREMQSVEMPDGKFCAFIDMADLARRVLPFMYGATGRLMLREERKEITSLIAELEEIAGK